MRTPTRTLLLVGLATLLLSLPLRSGGSIGPHDAHAGSATNSRLDATAVVALLDVLDALMAKHPDYAAEARRMSTLDKAEQRQALDAKIAANTADVEIAELIDALHATSAYQMYFLQFRNAPPAVHRRVLLALPYEAVSSPAGISQNFRELCLHRDEVRAWIDDLLPRINTARCRDIAAQWLPDGQYTVPPSYFIYDGNGDAFAPLGAVCFDLFSLVLRYREPGVRFENLKGVGVEQIERVLAHEYHHVFAKPLRHSRPTPGDWRQQKKDSIARTMVSEGVAMRCNVGEGVRRASMEDTVTVAFWMDQLNEKFAALDAGFLDANQWQQWYNTTFQDLATERLRDFLKRTYPGEDLDDLVAKHITTRPSLAYTLGWWMIWRILEGPAGYQGALHLLSEPHEIFAMYNEAIPAAPSELRVHTP